MRCECGRPGPHKRREDWQSHLNVYTEASGARCEVPRAAHPFTCSRGTPRSSPSDIASDVSLIDQGLDIYDRSMGNNFERLRLIVLIKKQMMDMRDHIDCLDENLPLVEKHKIKEGVVRISQKLVPREFCCMGLGDAAASIMLGSGIDH